MSHVIDLIHSGALEKEGEAIVLRRYIWGKYKLSRIDGKNGKRCY